MKVLLREIHRVPVHVQRERLQPHATQLHNSVVRLDNAYPIGVPKYSGMYMLCDYRVESDGLGVTWQSCGWVLCFSAMQLVLSDRPCPAHAREDHRQAQQTRANGRSAAMI
jgi:hypothetical protein